VAFPTTGGKSTSASAPISDGLLDDTQTVDVSKTISKQVDESEIALSRFRFGKAGDVPLDHRTKIGFAPNMN
jgi:hypothetical protein